MRFIDLISVKLTFYLIIGILLGYWLDINWMVSAAALIGFATILLIRFNLQKRHAFPWFGLVAFLTTMALGAFVCTMAKGNSIQSHFSKQRITTSEIWHLKVHEVLKPTPYSNRYFAKVKSRAGNQASGSLLLSVNKDSSTTLVMDEIVAVRAKATKIEEPLNPHQFDYQAYLEKKGINYQIRVPPHQIHSLFREPSTLRGFASRFREHIITQLGKSDFGEDELAVVQALLLGQRNDISESTWDDYRNAGAVHILAVSGLHVGILLLILQFFLRPLERLPKGKTMKLVLILMLLWTFAFIAGLSPSVVRAVTMFSFIAYALYLNRPTNTFNIIALSMFFILLIEPLFLFEVGFQMSYAAVFSIVWIYPKLQQFWSPSNWLGRYFWQLLSVSIAAQVGVLPISLYYFHQFPALFFISNLIVVPFLGIIIALGVLVLFLSLSKMVPEVVFTVYNALIKTMNSIIGWVAQQEAFVFKNIPFDTVQLILAYLMIFGLVFSLTKPKFKNIALLLGAVVLFSGWGIYQQHLQAQKEQLLFAHQTKNSVLLHQTGTKLNVYAHNASQAKRIVNAIQVGERITELTNNPLQNSYFINGKYVLILDSLGVYLSPKHVDYLILTQSPKVNLERVIDSVRPSQIIADGSNFLSYIKRWEATCAKKKLPFHYTGEKGAFYFK